HPSGRPLGIRHPEPADRCLVAPSAIVEGRPPPCEVGIPCPTKIAVNPMPVRIRAPAISDVARTPDPTITVVPKPVAVRHQRFVKHRRLAIGAIVDSRGDSCFCLRKARGRFRECESYACDYQIFVHTSSCDFL